MTDEANVTQIATRRRRPTEGVTHGGHSEVKIAALAAEFAAHAIRIDPVLGLERFAWSMRAWSHAEARAEVFRRWLDLDAVGLMNNRSTPRVSVLKHLAMSERAAERGRQECGLSLESCVKIAAVLRDMGATALSAEERKALLPTTTGASRRLVPRD